MTYTFVKHLHVTAAVLSILFFIVRAYWSVTGSAALHKKFVKITPHIVDTILLACGIILAVMLGSMQPWIWAKVVGIVLYIVIGAIAIKRGKTTAVRGVAAIIAVAVFFYIAGVAINHNPMSWLA